MIVQELSTYGAERFFLWSEIEQKSRLVIVDDLSSSSSSADGANKDSAVALEAPMCVLYSRWRPLHSDAESLVALFSSLLRPLSVRDTSACTIVVDAYIADRRDWAERNLQTTISAAMAALAQRTGVQRIVFGVTDELSALPGLERLYDTVERIAPGYDQETPTVLDFVVKSSDELAGHDPRMEPDATAGVFQLLCLSQQANDEDAFVQDMASKCRRNTQQNNKTTSSASASSSSVGVQFFSFVVILVAILLVKVISSWKN